MAILPSFHDDYLLSYEVQCEARIISLRVRDANHGGISTVIFSGVERYHFENDAFGNIILSLEAVSVETVLSEYKEQIAESYRMAGAPGPWAHELLSAGAGLTQRGVHGYFLSSSFGMSGWVLAKHVEVSGGFV
jgi:hypothetical protein